MVAFMCKKKFLKVKEKIVSPVQNNLKLREIRVGARDD